MKVDPQTALVPVPSQPVRKRGRPRANPVVRGRPRSSSPHAIVSVVSSRVNAEELALVGSYTVSFKKVEYFIVCNFVISG